MQSVFPPHKRYAHLSRLTRLFMVVQEQMSLELWREQEEIARLERLELEVAARDPQAALGKSNLQATPSHSHWLLLALARESDVWHVL
jgi:hypothetical protein